MWSTLLVLLSCFFLLCFYYKKQSKNRPTPTGFPLIGDTIAIVNNAKTLPQFMARLYQELDVDTFYHQMIINGVVRTRDANNAHFVQNDIECFTRRTEKIWNHPSQNHLKMMFGDGIFMADGQLWHSQRAFSQALFKKNSLDGMIDVFKQYGEQVLMILERCEQEGTVIDMQTCYNQYTMDSFGVIGFGVVFDSLTGDNPFPSAFDYTQTKVLETILNPYYWYFPDGRFVDDIGYMHQYIDQIIAQRKQLTMEELSEKNDLLSRFICRQKEEDYTDAFLRDLVLNFVIAGKDTTAQLISWMTYNLAVYPDIREKLTAEIDSFDGEFTRSNINALPYLDHVLHETLRLFPSVPYSLRRVNRDVELPDGTMCYKGEAIFIDNYNIHRNPKYWDHPEVFDPERWNVSPIKYSSQYTPFYGGQMVCLGKHLATSEAKTMIILLLKNYTFELAEDVQIATSLILKSTNGVKITVHSR